MKDWTVDDGKVFALLKLCLAESPSALLVLYRWHDKATIHEPSHKARVAGWQPAPKEKA